MSKKNNITEETIDALSRNFFKQAQEYGFDYEHYIKFVNTLLEYAIDGKVNGSNHTKEITTFKYDKIVKSLPIESERLSIRLIDSENDIDLIHKWLQDNYGKYFMLSLSSHETMDIDQLLDNENNYFGVITIDEAMPVGLMAFLNLDKEFHKAELRKLIGEPQYRGKGLGQEATVNWIAYGRDGLGLKKIYLRTVETNIRNIKLNEELGFKVEGILRNEVILDNTYYDVLRMGLVFD